MTETALDVPNYELQSDKPEVAIIVSNPDQRGLERQVRLKSGETVRVGRHPGNSASERDVFDGQGRLPLGVNPAKHDALKAWEKEAETSTEAHAPYALSPSGRDDNTPDYENNSGIASSSERSDDSDTTSAQAGGGRRSMTNEEILAAPATSDGLLKQDPARLASNYVKALQEVTERLMTATPDETTRLNRIVLWHSLQLDLCIRAKVVSKLPPLLESQQQAYLCNQLDGTLRRIHTVEKDLFRKPRTPKYDVVMAAHAKSVKWDRRPGKLAAKPQTPAATKRHASKDTPKISA